MMQQLKKEPKKTSPAPTPKHNNLLPVPVEKTVRFDSPSSSPALTPITSDAPHRSVTFSPSTSHQSHSVQIDKSAFAKENSILQYNTKYHLANKDTGLELREVGGVWMLVMDTNFKKSVTISFTHPKEKKGTSNIMKGDPVNILVYSGYKQGFLSASIGASDCDNHVLVKPGSKNGSIFVINGGHTTGSHFQLVTMQNNKVVYLGTCPDCGANDDSNSPHSHLCLSNSAVNTTFMINDDWSETVSKVALTTPEEVKSMISSIITKSAEKVEEKNASTNSTLFWIMVFVVIGLIAYLMWSKKENKSGLI
jgi:hypothetical protein